MLGGGGGQILEKKRLRGETLNRENTHCGYFYYYHLVESLSSFFF